MWVRDNLRRTTRHDSHLLVLERRVGYGNDEALLQEWPAHEGPLPNHLFSDVLSLGTLIWVLDMHHHLFVSTLGSVYIDATESEKGGMRKSVE